MSSLPRPLGSITNWAILRLGEVAFVAGALFPPVAQRQNLNILLRASVVGLLVLLCVYFHPFAFGCADDQGIIFCRYFKLYFVPWSDVARIERPQQCIDFELVVRLCRRVGLTRTVKFAMSFAGQDVKAFRDGSTPEIMTWLIDRLSSAQAPQSHLNDSDQKQNSNYDQWWAREDQTC
jgi:hypothetical protein